MLLLDHCFGGNRTALCLLNVSISADFSEKNCFHIQDDHSWYTKILQILFIRILSLFEYMLDESGTAENKVE